MIGQVMGGVSSKPGTRFTFCQLATNEEGPLLWSSRTPDWQEVESLLYLLEEIWVNTKLSCRKHGNLPCEARPNPGQEARHDPANLSQTWKLNFCC